MRIGPQRPVNPSAVVVPQGYRVEALIVGLTFPSAISFGPGGEIYLAEAGGVAGSVVAPPRVLRVDPDRSVNEIGRLENPIVGLVYRNGELLIGEDGPAARILRVTAEGEVQVLVEGLPGGGDYGLSGLAQDASGGLLFGLGTRTNSGVVGLDNLARGWVSAHPEWADVPGADVKLTGVNYVTSQPSGGGASRLATSGFKPFGHRSDAGETVRGSQRCGGAVYRLAPEGAEPERLAWGLRNPLGVGCGPDGRIFATEGGMEERGSRPIAGAADNLWEIQAGSFYGWPDFASGIPVSDPRFRLPGQPQPQRLLQDTPKVAGTPVSTFAPRSGVGRFDFSTSVDFGFAGEVFVALSGPWSTPAYPGGEASGGHRVVRVDPRTGQCADFLVNRQPGPSSAGNSGGVERPFDVQFDPTGEVLYVVDIGEVRLDRENGLEPFGGTGIVWRITRSRPMVQVPALAAKPAAAAEADAEAEDEAAGGETAVEEISGSEPDEDVVTETPVEEAASSQEEAPETGTPESGEAEGGEEPAPEAAADDTVYEAAPGPETASGEAGAGDETSGEVEHHPGESTSGQGGASEALAEAALQQSGEQNETSGPADAGLQEDLPPSRNTEPLEDAGPRQLAHAAVPDEAGASETEDTAAVEEAVTAPDAAPGEIESAGGGAPAGEEPGDAGSGETGSSSEDESSEDVNG